MLYFSKTKLFVIYLIISFLSLFALTNFSENKENDPFNLTGLQKLLSSTKRAFRFNNNGGFAAFIDMNSLNDALSFAAHFAELMHADLSA